MRDGERVIWGGRYEVYDEIASGGMATVYLAATLNPSPTIPAVVALKQLAPQFAKQAEFVAMFLDEAHLAARIRHPNVVTTYEFLRTEEGLGIVMDIVVGESLVQLLRGSEDAFVTAPLPVAAAILVDALEGLHAAHEATDAMGKSLNLVHRDVSPHNVLVGLDGVARVIDFGIAKAAGRLQTTDVGILKGKFAYMAPEQIQGAEVSRATDVYAAGVVFWEAVTGKKLFRSSSNEELLTQRSSGDLAIAPPSVLNRDVPAALDAIVLRALRTLPQERFRTARDMAEAIRADLEIADSSVVAAWVRALAGPKLDALEAKRSAIEIELVAAVAEPLLPSLPSLPAPAPRTSSPPAAPPTLASAAVPVVDIPESASEASLDLDIIVAPKKAPPLPPSRANGPPRAPRFGGDSDLREGTAPSANHHEPEAELVIELDDANGVGPGIFPGISPLEVERFSVAHRKLRPETRERRRYGGAIFLVVLLLVVGVGAGAFLRGPALVKARVLAAATESGLALTFDRVTVTRAGLTLHAVKAKLVGCPSLSLAAAEVNVGLDRTGNVQAVSFAGYDLIISGKPLDVAAEVAAWRHARHAPVVVDAHAGHVLWIGGAVPLLNLEALDVSLQVGAGASTESLVSLDTSSLLVNLPRGHMGPWHAHLDSTAVETRVRLGFDASSPDASPSATLITRTLEGSTVNIDVPRGSTFKVGIPTQLFGITSDLSIELALSAHVGASGTPITGEGRVGLYGLQVDLGHGAAVPVDLVASGSVAGPSGAPLPLKGGQLSLGKTPSPVAGTLALKDDGLRIELDRPSSRAGGAPFFILDTRDWTAPLAPSKPRAPAVP